MSDLSAPDFQKTQYRFAAHLRDPDANPAPADIEDRRLKIYRELVYNNIEDFISSGFPILRSLYADSDWHAMIRQFIAGHQSHSPYFLEISQEFLMYLQEEHQPVDCDPGFMLELAHYEWVELALDVAEGGIEAGRKEGVDVLSDRLRASSLAWRLSYQYPVHLIGPQYQPEEPGEEPTFLVVYRNRQEEVGFLQTNRVTMQLLQLLEESPQSGASVLRELAGLLGQSDPDSLMGFGREVLEQLLSLDIVLAE